MTNDKYWSIESVSKSVRYLLKDLTMFYFHVPFIQNREQICTQASSSAYANCEAFRLTSSIKFYSPPCSLSLSISLEHNIYLMFCLIMAHHFSIGQSPGVLGESMFFGLVVMTRFDGLLMLWQDVTNGRNRSELFCGQGKATDVFQFPQHLKTTTKFFYQQQKYYALLLSFLCHFHN